MASNKRGKIKEHFEGIHRNFDWITYHCQKVLDLVQDMNPPLSESVKALDKGAKTLDGLMQDLYGKL